MNWLEHRRAPRAPVDIEARLHLGHKPIRRGLILNVSAVGCLFLPQLPIDAQIGARGQLRFAVPTLLSWLQPRVEIRRATLFNRSDGQPAQGLGLEFSGLTYAEQKAINDTISRWDELRKKQYRLAARCFLQGEDDLRSLDQQGQVVAASRRRLRVTTSPDTVLLRGSSLRLRVGAVWVRGTVAKVEQARGTTTLTLVLTEEWGRDFFLHEARRAG